MFYKMFRNNILVKSLFIFFFLFLQSCVFDPPPPISTVEVFNKTSTTIYVYSSCSNKIEKFPQLELFHKGYSREENKEILINPEYRIPPKSKGYVYIYSQTLKKYFKNCKDKTLKIFFIDEKVMKEYSWEEIYEKQLFTRKIILREKYLKKGIVYN